MAATGRRSFLLTALMGYATLKADDSGDVHKVIGNLADALSQGSVPEAMACFRKDCPNYTKISDRFNALSDAYFIENRIDFRDEEVTAESATISVNWNLALTTRDSAFVTNREADISAKLVRDGKRWLIVEFAPINIFNPQIEVR